MSQHFKDLVAWQKSMDVVADVYSLTDGFPRRELYSLTDQMRRAAVSVPSNIAEGQAHYNKGEFLHHLRHARGSLAELETQVLIAQRLGYLVADSGNELLQRIDEVNRILAGLIKSLASAA